MNHKKWIVHYAVLCLIVTAAVSFDQLTKYLAVVNLKEKNAGTYVVIDKILQLTYVENRGTAFGIGQGKVWLFTIMSIVILAFVLFLYHRIPFQKRYLPMRIIAFLLTAGAIGNMIDRIAYGYVVDFLEFGFMDFPVFNVADIYVTAAEIMLIVFGLFFYKEPDFEMLTGKKSDTGVNNPADEDVAEDE